MSWIRIDDHFDEHQKLACVGPLGWGIWLAGLAYCNRNLTDGFIPRSVARKLGGDEINLPGGTVQIALTSGMEGHDFNGDWAITIMVDSGLWVEAPGGYQVHDYLEYQPSKAEVEELREQRKAAGQAGGQASAQARAKAKRQASAQAKSKQDLKQNPSKVQPQSQSQSQEVPSSSSSVLGTPDDDLPSEEQLAALPEPLRSKWPPGLLKQAASEPERAVACYELALRKAGTNPVWYAKTCFENGDWPKPDVNAPIQCRPLTPDDIARAEATNAATARELGLKLEEVAA